MSKGSRENLILKIKVSPIWWITAALLLTGSLWPQPRFDLAEGVLEELLTLLPLILIVAILAGWLAVSELAQRFRWQMASRPGRAILVASLVGAVTPVCGIASVPLVAALLRQGVPVSAAMAFWLSSPITDPGMLLLTAGILGWPFAAGKLLSALLLGLCAGALVQVVCRWYPHTQWLRHEALQEQATRADGAGCRTQFLAESAATFWLVMRWLTFALTLEALARMHLGDTGFVALAKVEGIWAVPLAVAIGGPLYIEGYAALPLLRTLIDMGLTPGAAMAFLISGAAISLYSAMAVWSLMRPVMFMLYLVLGIVGALAAGWAMDLAS